jgi:hypothetical protein
MTTPTKKSGALLAAALLTSSVATVLGGTPDTKPAVGKTVIEKAPASNWLSFYDGRLVFDLQERLRLEGRENNFDFNDSISSPTDDWWLLQRFRLGILYKPTNWLRFYVQGQDSQEWDSDREDIPGLLGAEGDDVFDLRQAYVEIGDPKAFPLSAKIGRQILSYGDERLIGAFDWNNIGRTFDAVRLRWEERNWWVDAFVSSVVTPRADSFNKSDWFEEDDIEATDSIFYGIYASTAAIPFQTTDVYALGVHGEDDSELLPPSSTRESDFWTLGFRMKSKPGAFAPPPEVVYDSKAVADGKSAPAIVQTKRPIGLDYTLEAAFQTGEVRGLDLTAFAAHLDIGYTFDTRMLPRVAVGYSFATGDGDPFDSDIETFQNLFPTNHKFYGQMDLFAWQNLHDIELNLKVSPIRSVTLRTDFHAFFLASTDDVWYRANGVAAVRPLTPAAREAANYAGSEIDVLVTWAVNKYLTVEAGYSHFFPGDYLHDTGKGYSADFAYLQGTLTF